MATTDNVGDRQDDAPPIFTVVDETPKEEFDMGFAFAFMHGLRQPDPEPPAPETGGERVR